MSPKESKKEQLQKSLRMLFLFGQEDAQAAAEIHKLTQKLLPLNYETREGRLYVGSGNPPNWEVQRGGDDKVMCGCPDWKFHSKKKGGDGQCKHTLLALALDLEIPYSDAAEKKKSTV